MKTLQSEVTPDETVNLWIRLFGFPPRAADLLVLGMLPGGSTVANIAEYIWDHWMGEPDVPTQQGVEEIILGVLNEPRA